MYKFTFVTAVHFLIDILYKTRMPVFIHWPCQFYCRSTKKEFHFWLSCVLSNLLIKIGKRQIQ